MSEATAAVLRESRGEFVLEAVELEAPRDDEILVRLEATGICHTDVELKRMVPTPSVLGHEGAGFVERVGTGVDCLEPGDRIVIGYAWCGGCAECRDGHRYRCEHCFPLSFSGSRLDGSSPVSQHGEKIRAAVFQQSSFATHVIAPARSAVKVDRDLPPEVAASLTCAVFTGAGTAVNFFGLREGDDLVVFGVGVVGLSAIMAAAILGAGPIIAVDLNADRLELARDLGATHSIDASADDIQTCLREVLPAGAKHILDTSAAAPAWDQAVDALGMGGTFGFVSTPQPWDEYGLKMAPLMGKAASVTAIIQGSSDPKRLTPQLIDWYRAGQFPIDRLIGTYPFADINRAFADMAAGAVVKPVLLMD